MPSPTLLDRAVSALDVVTGLWSPPANATSRQVRLRGAALFATGIGMLVLWGLLVLALDGIDGSRGLVRGLGMLLVLASYAMGMVGGYRMITGRSPDDDNDGLPSLRRIALGLASIALMIVVTALLVVVAAALFEPAAGTAVP